jgi:hypothetical protein
VVNSPRLHRRVFSYMPLLVRQPGIVLNDPCHAGGDDLRFPWRLCTFGDFALSILPGFDTPSSTHQVNHGTHWNRYTDVPRPARGSPHGNSSNTRQVALHRLGTAQNGT